MVKNKNTLISSRLFFTKETNPSVEDFDVQVIAQLKIFHVVNINPEYAKNNFKGIGELDYALQSLYRLNSINELEEKLK